MSDNLKPKVKWGAKGMLGWCLNNHNWCAGEYHDCTTCQGTHARFDGPDCKCEGCHARRVVEKILKM